MEINKCAGCQDRVGRIWYLRLQTLGQMNLKYFSFDVKMVSYDRKHVYLSILKISFTNINATLQETKQTFPNTVSSSARAQLSGMHASAWHYHIRHSMRSTERSEAADWFADYAQGVALPTLNINPTHVTFANKLAFIETFLLCQDISTNALKSVACFTLKICKRYKTWTPHARITCRTTLR